MTSIAQQRSRQNKSSFGAFAAGLVAVTGVAVATTIALKDKKTRDKVKNVLRDLKDQTLDFIDTLDKKVTNTSVDNIKPVKTVKTSRSKTILKKTKKITKRNLSAFKDKDSKAR